MVSNTVNNVGEKPISDFQFELPAAVLQGFAFAGVGYQAESPADAMLMAAGANDRAETERELNAAREDVIRDIEAAAGLGVDSTVVQSLIAAVRNTSTKEAVLQMRSSAVSEASVAGSRADDRIDGETSTAERNAAHRHLYETDAQYRAEMDAIKAKSDKDWKDYEGKMARFDEELAAKKIQTPEDDELEKLKVKMAAAEERGDMQEVLTLRKEYAATKNAQVDYVTQNHPSDISPAVLQQAQEETAQVQRSTHDDEQAGRDSLNSAQQRYKSQLISSPDQAESMHVIHAANAEGELPRTANRLGVTQNRLAVLDDPEAGYASLGTMAPPATQNQQDSDTSVIRR